MGSDASMVMGYGILITDDIDCYGEIDSDNMVDSNYRNPRNNGPLELGYHGCGDGDMSVIVFVRSTVIRSDWDEVKEFDPKKMKLPDNAVELLEIFFDKYDLKFKDPKWLIGVSY